MADEFEAEAFCRHVLNCGAAIQLAEDEGKISVSDGDNEIAKAVADFVARLKPHLADRRAVAGLREALVKIGRYDGPDFARHALLTANAALAAAGEGE